MARRSSQDMSQSRSRRSSTRENDRPRNDDSKSDGPQKLGRPHLEDEEDRERLEFHWRSKAREDG